MNSLMRLNVYLRIVHGSSIIFPQGPGGPAKLPYGDPGGFCRGVTEFYHLVDDWGTSPLEMRVVQSFHDNWKNTVNRAGFFFIQEREYLLENKNLSRTEKKSVSPMVYIVLSVHLDFFKAVMYSLLLCDLLCKQYQGTFCMSL